MNVIVGVQHFTSMVAGKIDRQPSRHEIRKLLESGVGHIAEPAKIYVFDEADVRNAVSRLRTPIGMRGRPAKKKMSKKTRA